MNLNTARYNDTCVCHVYELLGFKDTRI